VFLIIFFNDDGSMKPRLKNDFNRLGDVSQVGSNFDIARLRLRSVIDVLDTLAPAVEASNEFSDLKKQVDSVLGINKDVTPVVSGGSGGYQPDSAFEF
jgi:hypothetical protein